MREISAIIFLLLFAAACGKKFLRVENQAILTQYMAQIHAHNERIYQIKASLDIRATGVMGSFVHEQADIIVQSPHYLYWSLRSFFGPPSMILSSNGEFVTLYDFTGAGEQAYQKIPLTDGCFFELMGFHFHANSLIYLLLGQIPLDKGKELSIKASDNKLEIHAILPDGWELRSIFDSEQQRVLETRFSHKAPSLSYQVKYSDFHQIDGVDFPKSMVLFAKNPSRFARFSIEFVEVELNGAPVGADTFYISPH